MSRNVIQCPHQATAEQHTCIGLKVNGNHWSSVCILVSSGSVCVPQQNHGRSHQNNTSSQIFALYIFCWTKHVFNTQILTATFYRITNRELYSKAHGVLINHRDIKSDLSNLPTKPRPFFQKWIWMHFESPQNTRRLDALENLFNVTLNYRRDADIVLREQIMIKTEDTEDKIFPQVLDKKDKLVCWVVSNWNEQHERVKYYNELKKYINVIWGVILEKQ
ncbi:hypothetical protein QQF64_025299 [Cirrhinus molitorella]|uniref:Fucosyltransferase n=1 Tax=Cirrhinus molitorella TaxID=172907 RepID=A0ABR3NPA5_9TELE